MKSERDWRRPQTPLDTAGNGDWAGRNLLAADLGLRFSCRAGSQCRVTLYPCSGCLTRPNDKLSSMTWAWNRADGARIAYRQRLCIGCFSQRVIALPMQQADQPLTCPCCGIDTTEDMDPVFGTAFVPRVGRLDFEWPTCGPCAAKLRSEAQENALKLEDRRDQFGGLSPGPQTAFAPASSERTWADLGLDPNIRPRA